MDLHTVVTYAEPVVDIPPLDPSNFTDLEGVYCPALGAVGLQCWASGLRIERIIKGIKQTIKRIR